MRLQANAAERQVGRERERPEDLTGGISASLSARLTRMLCCRHSSRNPKPRTTKMSCREQHGNKGRRPEQAGSGREASDCHLFIFCFLKWVFFQLECGSDRVRGLLGCPTAGEAQNGPCVNVARIQEPTCSVRYFFYKNEKAIYTSGRHAARHSEAELDGQRTEGGPPPKRSITKHCVTLASSSDHSL